MNRRCEKFLALLLLLALLNISAADDIHAASNNGDLEAVKSLLAQNPELLSSPDEKYGTAFHHFEAPEQEETELPARFDLRDEGIITFVKNQGSECGACWAFAAVSVTEALIKRATGETVDLSEQQLVSTTGRGCDGGGIYEAFEVMKSRGIVSEEDFPYQGRAVAFDDSLKAKARYFLKDYYTLFTNKLALGERIDIIKKTLKQWGPVATNLIYHQDLDRYKGGVYIWDGVSPDVCGHNVAIVGWVDDASIQGGGYWIVKDCSGPGYGEDGFVRIAYGQCDIENFYICYAVYKPESRPTEK